MWSYVYDVLQPVERGCGGGGSAAVRSRRCFGVFDSRPFPSLFPLVLSGSLRPDMSYRVASSLCARGFVAQRREAAPRLRDAPGAHWRATQQRLGRRARREGGGGTLFISTARVKACSGVDPLLASRRSVEAASV